MKAFEQSVNDEITELLAHNCRSIYLNYSEYSHTSIELVCDTAIISPWFRTLNSAEAHRCTQYSPLIPSLMKICLESQADPSGRFIIHTVIPDDATVAPPPRAAYFMSYKEFMHRCASFAREYGTAKIFTHQILNIELGVQGGKVIIPKHCIVSSLSIENTIAAQAISAHNERRRMYLPEPMYKLTTDESAAEIARLRDEVSELKQKVQAANASIDSKDQDLIMLTEQLSTARVEVAGLRTEVAELRLRNGNLEKRSRVLDEISDEYEAENDALIQVNAELRRENCMLKEKIDAVASAIAN